MDSSKLSMILLCLFMLPYFSFGQDYIVSGFVTCEDTGEILAGVNVYEPVLKEGAITDPGGHYQLSLPAGNHKIVFSFIGYANQEHLLTLTDHVSLNARIQKTNVQLAEVIISYDQPNKNTSSTEMGSASMDMATIRNIPAFLGEADVLKAIQLLPEFFQPVTAIPDFLSGGVMPTRIWFYLTMRWYTMPRICLIFSPFSTPTQ